MDLFEPETTTLPASYHQLLPRWPGWDTSTVSTAPAALAERGAGWDYETTTTLYITGALPGTTTIGITGPPQPSIVTQTVTYQTQPGTEIQTVTVYPTTYTPPPPTQSTITVTEYPPGVDPRTITTTTTSGRSSATRTRTAGAGPEGVVERNVCEEGDASYQVPGRERLKPTGPAEVTLYTIAIMLVAGFIAWHLVLVRQLIYPVKLCVVAWHEFGHLAAIVLAGRHVEAVSIDPNEGGLVTPAGGITAYPLAALPWGYLSSILIGGALTFTAFNTTASKVSGFFVGISLACVWVFSAGFATKFLVTLAIGLLIGFYFIDHGSALRFYILFYGVLSSFYVIYDTSDDYIFKKPNPCCSALFHRVSPRISASTFALIWLAVSIILFVGFVLAAIATWRQSGHAMYCQSQNFLGT